MTQRVRLLLVVVRPPVLVLLLLFTATGVAQAGGAPGRGLRAAVAATACFLLFSVAVNDLADERIDRVNLPNDPRRPLVVGSATRFEMQVTAVTAALVALGAASVLGLPALALVAAGLLLSAGYSLPPVRLAKRGIVAPLVLPACYVVLPTTLGILAVRSSIEAADLVLLGSLYLGFIGRIVLKDFRDVRGDALFGKRTFLVRHGRRATCALSAVCWAVSTMGLLLVRDADAPLAVVLTLALAAVLALLASLAGAPGARREEAIVSTIAIVGRSTIAVVAAHLAMTFRGWEALPRAGVLAALSVGVGLQAMAMWRRGPISRLTVPAGLAERAVSASRSLRPSPVEQGGGTRRQRQESGSPQDSGPRPSSGQRQVPSISASAPRSVGVTGSA